ncbi:MAG TPA: nucleoside-diphosphate sugar epimerase/dehydratase [Gallionellaceae bacterium]|nr:nucleoside-diphosphate sugar epimerase/dehydratase [Gallionellaceae bacterium]
MLKSRLNTGIAMLHDVIAAAVAWWVAYLLRFNFDVPVQFQDEIWRTLIWVVPLQVGVFWGFGLYRGIWRYASVDDLRRILFAVIAATALIPLVLGLFRMQFIVPRSVLFIDLLLLLLVMGGSRLLYRLWKENLLYGDFHLQGEPVLVLGAGAAGIGLSKELSRSSAWHQVGFLDDDTNCQGCIVNGFKVLGKLDSLSHWAQRFGVTQAIIAMPSASHQVRKHIVDLASSCDVKALTVPSFDDLLSGRVAISQLRAVELDDLLGRDPVQLDDAGLHELLTGKTVLITGAGGSIGSELCRQIARFSPQTLLLFEASEFALYNMEQELTRTFPQLTIICLAGDVRDESRVEQVFAEFKPAVVFHAAAYKHVPMMEQQNSWQAVRNNVFGTWCVASTAQRHGAGKFVLISTDKAVNPTNVMGTTKRLAEMVCQGLQQASGTHFVMVRFGNVLGSTGSVIPKFCEQIAKGGPVTVTHPDITRYFMSIPEAAQLVLQAGLMGEGGKIFVLDMGEPVKIVDLARDLIRLSGLKEEDIKIEFSGLRPGEKLYEELLADNEHTLVTPHPKLRIAQARTVDAVWVNELLVWVASTTAIWPDDAVKQRLQQLVPEYVPTSNGK